MFCLCSSRPHASILWPAQLLHEEGAGACVFNGIQRTQAVACLSAQGESNSTVSPSDPRLKWANPEWLAPLQQQEPQQLRKPIGDTSGRRKPAAVTLRQSKLLKRVTYGSISSSSSSSSSDHHFLDHAVVGDSSSNSSSVEVGAGGSSCGHDPGRVNPSYHHQHEQLYQAMGIDYGTQRLGIAIRRNDSNVPLITLHRKQPLLANACVSSDDGGVDSNSHGSTNQQTMLIGQYRTAAAVLHLALEEGCDGFVIGLPQGVEEKQQTAGNAQAEAGAKYKATARLCAEVRGFAQKLADLASALELPVVLVNEQQSSQQARAMMSGAAAYDVKVMQQLTQQQQPAQQSGSSRSPVQEAYRKLGRDAFAAALILSRYYNELVLPELVLATPDEDSSNGADTSSSSSTDIAASRHSRRSFADQTRHQAAVDLQQMQVAVVSARRQRGKHRQRQQMVAQTT